MAATTLPLSVGSPNPQPAPFLGWAPCPGVPSTVRTIVLPTLHLLSTLQFTKHLYLSSPSFSLCRRG